MRRLLDTPLRLIAPVASLKTFTGCCAIDNDMPTTSVNPNQTWVTVEKQTVCESPHADQCHFTSRSGITLYPPMLNQHQCTFLSYTLFTFLGLVLISHFISTQLREAGYPISHLILIGLEKNYSDMTSTYDSNQHSYMLPTLLFTALIVLVTTAYAKLLRKGRLPCRV